MKRKLKAAGITAGLFAIILALGFGASKYPVKLFEVILCIITGLLVYGIYQGIYKNLEP